ncbi:MAG: hypothetical protein UU13_C0020G0012 [Candidatus Nomurabacteria bacterium GW2011_GWB1_40_7]|uniref:Uncharacterized protein n=1 Tax=Candidatus Nomurabacteria bacterium GW2011_GWB1_40_7 TaxID=1618744 RepID=A0A0G0T574_9BACT|nr:MAG: hypothetical protein UU13_C0020G0012 [Candidatus Nomurabacteria bacterium GW2011_GWB1_40_7]
MRSIERRFANFYSLPGKSSYIAFADAIKGQHFGTETIRYWFNKLVEKDDYTPRDKKDLFKHLLAL